MRLNLLHNLLFVATKLLSAEMAALKLIPGPGTRWQTADVVVGDTAQLATVGWQDGPIEPRPLHGTTRTLSLFGIEDALEVFEPKPVDVHASDTQSGSHLVACVRVSESLLSAMPGQFLHHDRRGITDNRFGTIWFAFGFAGTTAAGGRGAPDLTTNASAIALFELVLGVSTQALWTLYQNAQVHTDPVTKLPGLAEFRSRLAQVSQRDCASGGGLLLLLIAPDEFVLLRRRFGQEYAEALMRTTASVLEQTLRRDDGVYLYGDGVFAIVAEVGDRSGAAQLAEKLVDALRGAPRIENFFGTTNSLGYIFSDAESGVDLQQLCLGAEQVLDHARLQGGNQVVASDGNIDTETLSQITPQGGVFTTDPVKDHRNSRILWHTITLIAGETDPMALCYSFQKLLEETMNVVNVQLLELSANKFSSLATPESLIARQLNPQQQLFLRRSIELRKTQVRSDDDLTEASSDIHTDIDSNPGGPVWFATPLVSRAQPIGGLFLESEDYLDAADQVFIKALADQVAGAIDRIRLAHAQQIESSREGKALREELSDLRQADPNLSQPRVIARSTAMRKVLDYISKIAPTDASVLILGESGVGKEVMARAVHEASNRSDAPFITVDCGAIAHSLIDSELFGRVRGAYTGADEAASGRIAEAHGGTLFLDEIGELPLDVQSKLLRFVQEKELIAVGDTRRQIIDTRIICATNRNLLLESGEGRFRSDLYYRLQVIQLNVPPLRERPEDIRALTDLFVDRYSTQFARELVGLTDDAWRKIVNHPWPGNIRELQNSILRAILTAEGSSITSADLQLGGESPPAIPALSQEQWEQPDPTTPFETPLSTVLERHSNEELTGDHWTLLQALLQGQITALFNDGMVDAPLGRWLADAVVLTAAAVTDQVTRRSAKLLGIPETTLRRQLQKARLNADNPFQVMSKQWLATLPALTDLLVVILEQPPAEFGLTERCQALLLQEVANYVAEDRKTGAALMGVTPPTYSRWLAKYEIDTTPAFDATRRRIQS